MIFGLLLLMGSCKNKDYQVYVDKVEGLPERVDFNYHIKPILSDRCFACHGPDRNARSTEFRLDTEEGAFAALVESKGEHAIVSGDPHNSEIFRRIVSDDPEYKMPPPESNLTLTPREVALITKWIDQGAGWKKHWSFIPPEDQKPPDVKNSAWVKNDIDRFVLARLEQEGLQPSQPAEKEQLIRRITFDLTGLPPTLEEIDAFIEDKSDNPYEKVVDRLLASKAYGERMATDWMDVARYADSHGYQADGLRTMWPWRDWVIQAYNENMPFDQFVTWQLAGDMLPNATREQILATGFNRNHALNSEAGAIDEEFRTEYVLDRTNTIGKAFLGLTLECSRCHDHKYDPILQKDYYQLSAFFNNVKELGVSSSDGNAGPTVLLPEKEVEEKLNFVKEKIREQEDLLAKRKLEVEGTGSTDLTFVKVGQPSSIKGLIAHYPLDVIDKNGTPNLADRSKPGRISGQPTLEPGAVGQGLRFDNEYEFLSLPKVGMFEKTEPFSIGVWVKPEKKDDYAEILGNAGTKNPYWRGYEVFLDSVNRISVRLTHALPHNYIQVTTTHAIPVKKWSHFMMTYDGSGKASGLTLCIDGVPVEKRVDFDNLYKSIIPVNKGFAREERPIRVAKSYRAFSGDNGVFEGSIDDIRIYDRNLTYAEVAEVYGIDPLRDALAVPESGRSKAQRDIISEYYLSQYDDQFKATLGRLFDLRTEELSLMETVQEVMVMKEMDTPRKTHILHRGVWDVPGDEVQPGTPEAVMEFSKDLPRNRLGLAKWLVSPKNPLFARVTVNRFWKSYFGKGIVSTPDDFGNQGALPTHPELLDWLAIQFIQSNWDVKAFQKLIVMSATYQQSSSSDPELFKKDPANTLLARGPNYRLPAEMIRDNALAASGLLVKKIGGPSVKPYQPAGLWEEKGEFSHFLLTYQPDHGDGLYRRSLYTFWRRTSPPPSMLTFDTGSRYLCTVDRQTTNSPQQALVLLNDPQYVEASRVLGERMMKEGGQTVDERITYAFRMLTSRKPTSAELELLDSLYQDELGNYKKDKTGAEKLLSVGEHPRDRSLDVATLAANSVVASIIMNHDAAYTKR